MRLFVFMGAQGPAQPRRYGHESELFFALSRVPARLRKHSFLDLYRLLGSPGSSLRYGCGARKIYARGDCGAAGEFVALCGIVAEAGGLRFGIAGGHDAARESAAVGEKDRIAAAFGEERRGVLPYPFV